MITSRRKDVAIRLLEAYGLDHAELGTAGRTPFRLACELLTRTSRLVMAARRFRPDVMTAIGGTFIAPAGKLLGIPAVTFTDTENATHSNRITFPLTTVLAVPECWKSPIGRNVLRYHGYHELAYLHPRRFTPDESVRDLLGVGAGEHYAVLRFVSWTAGHDIGHAGISMEFKRRAVAEFSRHVRVFISSERPLPDDLAPHGISIPPERMHDVLAFADLLYGESATMASECAMLGTPSIYLDDAGRGYTDELDALYCAVFTFTESIEDQARSVEKGLEILSNPAAKNEWAIKRERILADTIDVTAFVVETVSAAGRD